MDRPAPAGGVVITGAGRGLGAAMTRRFAGAGWSVLAVDRDEEPLRDMADRLANEPGRVSRAVLNLLEQSAPDAVVEAAVAAFGRIDVLLNNAGVAPLIPFLETTREQLRSIMDLNFEMQFWLTQAVARRMIEQGEGGAIINIGTIHTEVGFVGGAAYSASKAALTSWSRTLAAELAPHRIRVNTIAPGPVATDRVRRQLTTEQIERRVARIPAGRMGDVDDIAGTALFLAGPDAQFINGQLLIVDGGLTSSAAL